MNIWMTGAPLNGDRFDVLSGTFGRLAAVLMTEILTGDLIRSKEM